MVWMKRNTQETFQEHIRLHSDITSELALVISQTINGSQLQGWCNRLQRDEVVAEWKKVKGKISLHVHCHISGGHFLLNLCAKLRFFIFYKELPVAFVHGDDNLFQNYPELEEALVWIYFHSNISEFNRVECWGLLIDAAVPSDEGGVFQRIQIMSCCSSSEKKINLVRPEACEEECTCCFPPTSMIPWSQEFADHSYQTQRNQILQQL